MRRVRLFLLVQVPVMLVLALVAALAIDSARLRRQRSSASSIFLPYAVPAVVAALMWGFIYGDALRPGRQHQRLPRLSASLIRSSRSWILASIGNIITWEFVGYNMLIFYAALRDHSRPTSTRPPSSTAPAPFRVIRTIKLPAIRGAIVIATIFSVIGSFQLFNEPNILQAAGPELISTHFTPNMYAYNLSFAGQQFNYSATIAIIMGVLTMIVAYVVQLRGSRKEA